MINRYSRTLILLITCFILSLPFAEKSRAQSCVSPAKQVVLKDLSGNYYVFWKPVSPPPVINFLVKVHCTNLPPCGFSVLVTSANVIKMNGGYLGVKIPALPSINSMVEISILPPNCTPQYKLTFLIALDLVTDNLDISTADCDGDTCKIFISKWKTLKELTDYAVDICGPSEGLIAASTVTAVDAPVSISLRRNANGKWQLKTKDSVYCDSCYLFIFQITCPDGNIYFVEDSICFNYTGPPIGCREADELISETGISIYPNPANDKSILRMDLDAPGKISVVIYSSLGERVSTIHSSKELDQGSYEMELPVASLTQGLYIVEVRINDEVQRIKFLKF